MEELNNKIAWWATFVKEINSELQHFDDYLHDLDKRRLIAKEVFEIKDSKLRNDFTAKLKDADEVFIGNTDCFPTAIVEWKQPLHPDTDWMFYRSPRNVGKDFPK